MDVIDLYMTGIGVLLAFSASVMLFEAVPGLVLGMMGVVLLAVQMVVFAIGEVDLSSLSLQRILDHNWLPAKVGIPLGLVCASPVHAVKLVVSKIAGTRSSRQPAVKNSGSK